jgi:hypothetical protein
LQRTCKAQLDIHNARRRRAYAAASKKAGRVGARTAAASRPASAVAAPRRTRKLASASVGAPRPAPAVAVDAFSAAFGNSLGALLLPALVAMSQPQLAPPIAPVAPPVALPPVLQAVGEGVRPVVESILRAGTSKGSNVREGDYQALTDARAQTWSASWRWRSSASKPKRRAGDT